MVKEIKDLQGKTEDQGFPGSGKKENAGSSKGKESGGRAIPDRLARSEERRVGKECRL